MRKSILRFSAIAASIVLLCTAFAFAWDGPVSGDDPKKSVAATSAPAALSAPAAGTTEEFALVRLLEKDGLVNQFKGYTVEKKDGLLFIDGKALDAAIAAKYMPVIKKDVLRIQVSTFMERMSRHPEAGFLQILMPVNAGSPCVRTGPPEGC